MCFQNSSTKVPTPYPHQPCGWSGCKHRREVHNQMQYMCIVSGCPCRQFAEKINFFVNLWWHIKAAYYETFI